MDEAAVADDVEAGVREFIRRTAADHLRLAGSASISLEQRRAIAEEVRRPWTTGGPKMAATSEVRIGSAGLRLRIHRPVDAPALPVLAYVHGGGWTIFSLDTHDRLMREYAAPEMADFWSSYRGDERGPNPLARPLLGDFTGMPPTFVCIPECDILADENRELAERMRAAGVAVTERVYPGATHSFLEAAEVSALASRALDETAAWLRGVLFS